MKYATFNTNNPIEKIVLALLLILSPSLLFGNAMESVNTEVIVSGSSIVRKGWLAAPAYTQEWLVEGIRGDRLVIKVSPISGEIDPEICLISGEDDTEVASSTRSEENHVVLDHQIEATGTYTVVIRDQCLDNEGGYEISLEKIAGAETSLQTSAVPTAELEDDEDESGLSGWEIATLVTVGTVLTILTGPFAPLAMMVAARIAALFPV